MFVVTGSLLAACIVGYLPVQMLIVVGMIFTVAFLLLLPIVLGLLAWLVAAVLRPLLGTEGRIAHRQILRRRVRTTLTIGILYLAVSTAISLGTNILDNVQDIHTWLETTLQGRFLHPPDEPGRGLGPVGQNARIARRRPSRHRGRGQRGLRPADSGLGPCAATSKAARWG